MPAAERQQEKSEHMTGPSKCGRSRITGRIPGLVPGPERGLTCAGWPFDEEELGTPEPKGKLDVAVPDATAVMAELADDGSTANGPEDLPDWDAIDWRHQEEHVRRLRQRIFKADEGAGTGTRSQPAED